MTQKGKHYIRTIENSPARRNILKKFIAGIPQRHILQLGKMLGTLLYLVDPFHRRIIRCNLKFSNPHFSQTQIHKLIRRIFQNTGVFILEALQLSFFTKNDLQAKVHLQGMEHLERAIKGKRGAILISAHLGNWEVGMQAAACALSVPTSGVIKKIHFEPLNNWMIKLRTQFGIKVIYKKGALPEMRKALRRGEATGLLVDQSRRVEGVETRFFGKKVMTTPAPAFLALRCKSPILPIFCVREPSGELTVIVMPPLELVTTGNLKFDMVANTQMITDTVEKIIRQYPDQWFWFHKRWKKFYPELYPRYMARQQRRLNQTHKR